AVLDVAPLARADPGLASHARALDGKGQDLRLTLLPLAGEGVADEAARLAAGRARHDGAVLLELHHALLVVVVAVRLRRGDEARAHPDALGAQRQCGRDAPAVGHAARGHDQA